MPPADEAREVAELRDSMTRCTRVPSKRLKGLPDVWFQISKLIVESNPEKCGPMLDQLSLIAIKAGKNQERENKTRKRKAESSKDSSNKSPRTGSAPPQAGSESGRSAILLMLDEGLRLKTLN